MECISALEPVISAANSTNTEETDDYRVDGLLYCGKCHKPKQTRTRLRGKEIVVPCTCACDEQNTSCRKEEEKRIMRLRSSGIASQVYRNASFEADDGENPAPMQTLFRYAQNWEEMYRGNIGLFLYGAVGTGKSFGAACVANDLIKRNIPVYMVNLPTVLNALGGFPSKEKNDCIADLMRYPLLILDDFGMERQTEYVLEQVFNIIDARYRCGKPLIVTTNLPYAELKKSQSIEKLRIYDRIREMCIPVNFGDVGRRAEKARLKMQAAAEILIGGKAAHSPHPTEIRHPQGTDGRG